MPLLLVLALTLPACAAGGPRASSVLNGTAHVYSSGPGGVVHDTAGSTVYTPGVSQRQGTTDLFFHTDWLGSTRYLTDSSGNNAPSAYRFDAYGGTTASAGPDSTSFKWAGAAGYQSDAPAGLVLLGQRYYDPQEGRFLSPDPIGLAGGFNEYAYCGGDPVNHADPSGLCHSFIGLGGTIAQDTPPGAEEIAYAGHVQAVKGQTLATGAILVANGPILAYGAFPGVGVAGSLVQSGNDIGAGRYGWGLMHLGLGGLGTYGEAASISGRLGGMTDDLASAGAIASGVGCFTAGTRITTAKGDRPIEEIRPGDRVISADLATGRQSTEVVEKAYARHVNTIVVLTLEGERHIETTREQPFWVKGKGFVEADQLARGSLLRDRDGRSVVVRHLQHRSGQFRVYNLRVGRTHTYLAGGVWVHNADWCPGAGPIYRGGPHLIPKPGELKIRDGLVQPTHGLSLHTDPTKLERFGGAHELEHLPEGLKIIQRGQDPNHYEIVPAEPIPLEQFEQLLQQVNLRPPGG